MALNDMAVADFNEDSYPDLVAVSMADSNARVLLSHGDGTFAAATLFSAGSSNLGVTEGDVNSDGHVYIIIVGRNDTIVHVLGGDGDGTFRLVERYAISSALSAPVLADINIDSVRSFYLGAQVLPGGT